jgi:superfamily II DNA or RNA helicase
MKITISSPTKAYVNGTDEEMELLRKQLSYKDLSAQHELKRISKNHWFKTSNPVKWQVTCDALKEKINQCLVFEEGPLRYIRPGSISYLEGLVLEVEDQVVYPKPKKIPWYKPLPFDLYPYQEQSWTKLLEAKHSNVSLTTGSGKSALLLKLCRETGFRCAIVAPGKAIFNELVEKFEFHFGKGNIGKFGAGKKKLGKRITICIGDSLCNVKRDSEEWKFFSGLEMLAIDESHTWGSETLEEVCHGIFSEVPYRFFLSATQIRNDGGLKLLQSIIGPTVHTLTTKEAVDGGYICKHDFRIVQIESSDPSFSSQDVLEEKRHHLLRNKNIAAFAAKLANVMGERGQQTLILVEELNQIAMLKKLITVPFGYAHSETKKERLLELGLEKVDVAEQIERFNRNEIKALVVTSCGHTGVNLFGMTSTVNWVGGASEIKTRQAAIGRSIRLPSANPYKAKCGPKEKVTIYDFDIQGSYVMERHLEARMACYADSGEGLIKYIRLSKT